jgi:hypothetical protein
LYLPTKFWLSYIHIDYLNGSYLILAVSSINLIDHFNKHEFGFFQTQALADSRTAGKVMAQFSYDVRDFYARPK